MTGAPLGNGGTARQSPTTPDVVAGMPFGPLAPSVARAAVHEAVRYGARVRFLQVLQAGTSDQQNAAFLARQGCLNFNPAGKRST